MSRTAVWSALAASAFAVSTWSEYPACPPPVTVNNTQYIPVTDTTTIYETIIYTDTITTTQSTTETQIQLSTETEITTESETETEVQVQLQTQTEIQVQHQTETEIVVQLQTETERTSTTLIETTPTTITETMPKTITETTPTTELSILTATEELELYTSTTRLTSLRICPSRTVNPYFTVEDPMPTQWTWGCPPGWICKPLQENCDFEAGVPDRNFYCAPNECVPAPQLPQPLPYWSQDIYSNSTPLNTPGLGVVALEDYFNMGPTDFGFGYEIFVVHRVFTITSTFVVPPAAPTATPIPQGNGTVVNVRQTQAQIPGQCYTWCNNGMLEVQALGKTPRLCQPESAFLISMGQCRACIDYHSPEDVQNTDTFVRIAPQFQQFIDYCDGYTTTTLTGSATFTTFSGDQTVTSVELTTSVTAIPTSDVPVETVVPTTVTAGFTNTSISGIGPRPPTTITGSQVTELTIIMPTGGSETTLSGTDLEDATLILAARGAQQTEIVTSGESTYTTEVTSTLFGDETSAEGAGGADATSAVESDAAAATSQSDAGTYAAPAALALGLPLVVALYL